MVVVACASSAGAHAGLVPAHLEHEPRIGGAFVVAVILLAAAAIALALRAQSARAARAAWPDRCLRRQPHDRHPGAVP